MVVTVTQRESDGKLLKSTRTLSSPSSAVRLAWDIAYPTYQDGYVT
jgi:hypothetical protein